jgi:hypothetical protein
MMLVSIAEHIGAPIGATTCPLRVTATTHTAVRDIAVTIQPMSGSATTDSGGTTDSLTRRGGQNNGWKGRPVLAAGYFLTRETSASRSSILIARRP